ncbi:hypothetical protein PE066_18930 [Ramlibacter tataouinensis]|uniref:hypothetical protein n=1 Tax=Ramlibacter tataouinensis TaxID=94132 RepID=UPI0022F3B961|nr:hypothetical protein [Ramlibacter tataouinensis]WBY01514.1 hypothetical protein PE066_18930 [Ramlibacter tataouinensis]
MFADDVLDRLPLRQSVKPTGEASFAFAERKLLDWLSRPAEFQITRYGEGGQIHAASESALGEAQSLLREAYGALISFGEPLVHTWICPREEQLMEPIMQLRVEAGRAHVLPALGELKQRNADVQEVELEPDRAVFRAEIRLADLLGYERAVEGLTGEAAHVLSRLLRYQPASSGSMPGAGSWYAG